jgi:hypothetical protein
MTAGVGKHSLPQFEGAKIGLIWLKSKDSEYYFDELAYFNLSTK